MISVGIGFDTKGAGKITVKGPSASYIHAIDDSREGNINSLQTTSDNAFHSIP
jgi:hypothetical protein